MINLASILNSGTTATSGGTSTGTPTRSTTASAASQSASASPLGAIEKRVQTDLDSTKTQLSAFGVLKSAVSQSQIAAQAIGRLGTHANAEDMTKAMADFFNGYNGVVAASQTTSTQASDVQGTGRVRKDFQWALSGAITSDALKKLGLNLKSDGTLVQTASQFANALKTDPAGVRAALGKLGMALDTAATRELDPNGTVGATLGRLNQRSTSLAAQQKALISAAQSLAAYKSNS